MKNQNGVQVLKKINLSKVGARVLSDKSNFSMHILRRARKKLLLSQIFWTLFVVNALIKQSKINFYINSGCVKNLRINSPPKFEYLASALLLGYKEFIIFALLPAFL